MGLRINTNVASLTAQRHLQSVTDRLRQNYARLSSGLRIATAADDAAGLARKAMELLGEDAESFFILGVHAGAHDDAAGAVEYYRRAVRLEPSYLKARLNLGVSLSRSGGAAEAVEVLQAILDEEPGHINARYNLGNALSRLGRAAAAADEFATVLKDSPDDGDARYNLADLLVREGRLREAGDQLGELVRRAPGDVEVRLRFGNVLFDLGRYDSAMGEYIRAGCLDSSMSDDSPSSICSRRHSTTARDAMELLDGDHWGGDHGAVRVAAIKRLHELLER